MRLDARKGDQGWFVWHVEQCRHVKHVVWIDDETATWGEYCHPLIVAGPDCLIDVHQAKRIEIIAARKLVLIDPVSDGEPVADERRELAMESTGPYSGTENTGTKRLESASVLGVWKSELYGERGPAK